MSGYRQFAGSLSVLCLIDSLAAGGAERSLAEVAPRLVSQGVRLEVAVLIDRGGLSEELEAAGIAVHRVSGSTRTGWLNGTAKLVRSTRPDLLHTTLFEADIAGRLVGSVTGTPVVCTLATTAYGRAHAKEAGIRTCRLRGAQLADAITARRVRRFHAVSDAVADACVANLRLNRAKIDVIPRGRGRDRLGYPGRDRRVRVRSSLGIPPGLPVLLFVGRHEPAKGIDVLLGALARLLEVRAEATLLIVGREGRATIQVRQLVASLNLANAVRELGERDDIGDLLCAADILVLPSYREGLPGAVIEAMAMQVPVVASDIPAVREAVPNEDYAYLVTPGDPIALSEALISALSDPKESGRRADRSAIRFEETFDLDAVTAAMIGFYRRALRD